MAEDGEAPRAAATKSGFSAKDWAALSLSLLAFIVSAGSTYFSIIRIVDDVRVSIEGAAFMHIDNDTGGIIVRLQEEVLAFSNLGNRPAAILSVALSLYQPDQEHTATCDGISSYSVRLNIQPFVVKPGDIILQQTKLDDTILLKSEKNARAQEFVVEACLTFNIVTPDNESGSVTRLLYSETVMAGGNMTIYHTKSPHPEILLKSWGTVFDRK